MRYCHAEEHRKNSVQAGQLGASVPVFLGTGGSPWTSELMILGTGFALCVLSWHPVESQYYLWATFLRELLLNILQVWPLLSQKRETGSSSLTRAAQQSLPLSQSVTTGLLQQQNKDSNSTPVKIGSVTFRLAPKAVILRPQERELPSMYVPVLPGFSSCSVYVPHHLSCGKIERNI